MQVKLIKIQNILGLEEMEIEPGRTTVVSGPNGAGKTSTLEAIKAVLGGGHDATLLRRGADEGRVVLVLDDGLEITKRITEDGSTVRVRHPEMGVVGAPQSYLNRLTHALAFNPVSFLTAPAEKRAEWLLEAVPMELSSEELEEALGGTVARAVDLDRHALEVIEIVRRDIYDKRTGINRTAREKRATASQLSESIPAGWQAPEEIEDEIRDREGEREVCKEAFRSDEARVRERCEAEVEAVRSGYQEKIEALQAKIDRFKEAEREEAGALLEERDKALEKIAGPAREMDAELRSEIAALRERLENSARHANTSEVIRQHDEEADKFEAASKELTSTLERLDELKGSLLERIPIEGLEVQDGELVVDGVAFDRLNRARQVEIALEVAKLRAGELRLVCVDGLECLDSDTFDAFLSTAAEGDLQLIATRVTDGEELKVEGVGA